MLCWCRPTTIRLISSSGIYLNNNITIQLHVVGKRVVAIQEYRIPGIPGNLHIQLIMQGNNAGYSVILKNEK